MPQQRVLVTTYFLKPGDEVDFYLTRAGVEPVFNPWHGGRTEEEMVDILQGIDGVVASSDPFTARVLASAPRLKVISRTGVGYDAIDVREATARGIAVCTAPGSNNVAVAEHAFALMISCAKRLEQNTNEVRRGGWTRHAGVNLDGKVLGILGLGSIGKEMARRALAFGMRVIAVDPMPDAAFAEQHGIAIVGLEQLLKESDFVSIHCFLDQSTHHLIDARALALLKPTAYLINTARGGIVDTIALVEALRAGRLAGAGLDVFEQEPLGESPLNELDNVVLSPHGASATLDAFTTMGLMAAENAVRVLRGEPPLHIVNPEALK